MRLHKDKEKVTVIDFVDDFSFNGKDNYLMKHCKERIDIYKKEHFEWRKSICANDCMIEGKCKYCGCSVPGKLYVKKSCNDGERFPDMMDELEWNYYKKINGIVI
jgi:hypothetical protein